MAKDIQIYKFNIFENAIIYCTFISSHLYLFWILIKETTGL
jgi:hypothetical protein